MSIASCVLNYSKRFDLKYSVSADILSKLSTLLNTLLQKMTDSDILRHLSECLCATRLPWRIRCLAAWREVCPKQTTRVSSLLRRLQEACPSTTRNDNVHGPHGVSPRTLPIHLVDVAIMIYVDDPGLDTPDGF